MAVPGRKVSDGHLTVFCQPCDRDGERLAAHGYCKDCCEHLCEFCYKHHKRHTLSRDHILVDKTNMPQTLQLSSAFHYQQHDDFTKPCRKHKREVIKFYCHYHNELLCSVCVTLGHQSTSCKVGYIPDISENVFDGKEYLELLKTMDSMSEQFRQIQDRIYRLTIKANKTLANVLEDIKLFRKEINQKLDELEKQAAVEVNVFQDENVDILKNVETACNDRTIDLLKSCNSMKRLNSSKQAEKLFIEVKSADIMIEDCEKKLAELAKLKVNCYSFTSNKTISKLLTSGFFWVY
ncbi:transcription intermediary factor 1-alpha-like [Ruditapes philippinarum]|uniref:transcription intermediary factor 1-alpha-like n=1 Tax=Ruditapes philippinarum TaxID=129788 RepID=UPI00295B97C4|nr:transcription intermediary factor 1-alpha-like [Ruditapes philippinarum]